MIIGCTKKLLDFLGIKPLKTTTEIDPLFSWTANLVTINRRKTLVAVNNASKCAFVLYGLTAKMIGKISELVLDGIRAVLESEYIAPDIIENYLDSCGRDVTFVSNSSRSDTAYCNKACERVERFTYLFEAGDMLQQKYLPWINYYPIAKESYICSHEKLISSFTEKYGAPVQSADVAELEITLDLLTPCKRTLIVPCNINFYQLHKILQSAFEWHDRHLHQFVLKKDSTGRPTKLVQIIDAETEALALDRSIKNIDSVDITVKDAFEKHKKIEYEYDFGDDWIHTIKLKRFIKNCSAPYPHCTEAIGDAPMEDSGGAYGFDEKMRILNDPKHPDHEWISDWVRRSWWNPLDINAINRRLQEAHRVCVPICYD